MSCSCPAAATSSRIGTASVAPPRNGLTLSFQVSRTDPRACRILLALLGGTPDEINVDAPEMCRKKANPCPTVFALTCCSCICFCKVLYLLLCCDLFFPPLSQSMHSATGNKFDLDSVPTQPLFCMIFTDIVYALSYFPQEARFLFKKRKDMLISVSVLCCCSEQREPVPAPWLQLVPQSTAGKNPGLDCQLHSGFSQHICESTVRSKCQRAQGLHNPLPLISAWFNPLSIGALQGALDFKNCQLLLKRFRSFLSKFGLQVLGLGCKVLVKSRYVFCRNILDFCELLSVFFFIPNNC